MTNRKPGTVWAYAYELAPPLPEDRLRRIKALLDREHAIARNGARTWASRLVLEERVTHIMVVSDTPEQDLDANHRLERELRGLKAGYSITAPMPVADEPVPPPVDLDQS